MITIKEYTEQLETENRTLYEDKNYWKKLAEKRKSQLQQKENIIKEVREYIKNNTYKIEWGDLEQDNEDININEDLTDKEFIENLLEILDKVEEK